MVKLHPHPRGTTLLLAGQIKEAGAARNIANDTLRVIIADPDTASAVQERVTPSGDLDQTQAEGLGKWTCTFAASYTKTGTLPKEEYRVHVFLTEPDGREHEVARGLLPLVPSPRGVG